MKKIISAILALTMCVALIGSAAALDVDETTGAVTYTFGKTGIQTLNNVTLRTDTTSSYNDVVIWDPINSKTIGNCSNTWFPTVVVDFGNHGWKFFGVGSDITDALNTNVENGNMFRLLQFGGEQAIYNSNSNASFSLTDGKTNKLAYELQTPAKPSYYRVTVGTNGVGNSNNATANFYMNPKSEALTTDSSATSSALLGEVTYNNTSKLDSEFSKVVYADGTTNLVFTMNPQHKPDEGLFTNNGIKVYYATLTPIEGVPTFSISGLTLGKLSIGDTAQISVNVGDYDVVDSFVSYTVASGSEEVVEIDESGVVTALAEGTGTIVASVGNRSEEIVIDVTAEKTYYFAKKGDIAKNNVIVNNITVGLDSSEPGVYDGSLAKFYADAVIDFGSHGWKYYDINDAAYLVWKETDTNSENYVKEANPRIFQFNADNVRIDGIFMAGKADPEVRAALELEAPSKSGFYTISTNTSLAGADFYTGPKKTVVESGTEIKNVENYINEAHLVGTTVANNSEYASDGDDIKIDKQTSPVMAAYSDGQTPMILAYKLNSSSRLYLRGYKLTYIENADPVIKAGDAVGKSVDVELKNNNRGRVQVRTGTSGIKVTDSFVSYKSNNPEVVTVDDAGVLVAKSVGEATITAEIAGETLTANVTVYEEDSELKNAFTAESTGTAYTAPDVVGLELDGQVITAEDNGDGSFNLTAPETKEGKGNFLYWAKGLSTEKRILLYKTNELENYVPGENGHEYLIAVYEGDVSDAEYYNANGQLIPDATQTTEVSMAGYGSTSTWKQYGNTNIWVAQYSLKKPEANITIETTACTLNKEGKYAYGDVVECTAQIPDGKIFKCWKKNGKIVSIDETYTFKAWEDCGVEAVYVEDEFKYTGNTMKIIIDDFTAGDETGVMAEFIGLDNAVEKGIMFTATGETKATKIAMTTKDNQFTVIADEPGTYVGYAILRNGNAFTLITDGLYTHNK